MLPGSNFIQDLAARLAKFPLAVPASAPETALVPSEGGVTAAALTTGAPAQKSVYQFQNLSSDIRAFLQVCSPESLGSSGDPVYDVLARMNCWESQLEAAVAQMKLVAQAVAAYADVQSQATVSPSDAAGNPALASVREAQLQIVSQARGFAKQSSKIFEQWDQVLSGFRKTLAQGIVLNQSIGSSGLAAVDQAAASAQLQAVYAAEAQNVGLPLVDRAVSHLKIFMAADQVIMQGAAYSAAAVTLAASGWNAVLQGWQKTIQDASTQLGVAPNGSSDPVLSELLDFLFGKNPGHAILKGALIVGGSLGAIALGVFVLRRAFRSRGRSPAMALSGARKLRYHRLRRSAA